MGDSNQQLQFGDAFVRTCKSWWSCKSGWKLNLRGLIVKNTISHMARFCWSRATDKDNKRLLHIRWHLSRHCLRVMRWHRWRHRGSGGHLRESLDSDYHLNCSEQTPVNSNREEITVCKISWCSFGKTKPSISHKTSSKSSLATKAAFKPLKGPTK